MNVDIQTLSTLKTNLYMLHWWQYAHGLHGLNLLITFLPGLIVGSYTTKKTSSSHDTATTCNTLNKQIDDNCPWIDIKRSSMKVSIRFVYNYGTESPRTTTAAETHDTRQQFSQNRVMKDQATVDNHYRLVWYDIISFYHLELDSRTECDRSSP